jgi:3-mercaptopyruvate sulfurtransferase SseA
MKMMVIVVVACLAVTAYGFADSELDSAPRMNLEEFKTRHGKNSLHVVDVRYPRDYEAGHIPGAVLIPPELLSAYLSELSTVNKPIVTYCH